MKYKKYYERLTKILGWLQVIGIYHRWINNLIEISIIIHAYYSLSVSTVTDVRFKQ